MKLKLSDYSSIADVVAAIAIVVSLVYVGIQISDNTRATRSANANAASSQVSSAYATVGSNPETSEIFYRALTDPTSVTPAERAQFVYLVQSFMLAFQNSYYLSTEGTLDAQMRESITENLKAVKDQPGFRLFWGALS